MQHDIFRTPNQVNLTIAPEPTPETYSSHDLGETMPMWRVQTEGYEEGNDQLIGLVSRDEGFLDSPDTEWISSGVNSKNPDAVAIGRHGNFFLWGFAASPTFLTEEAKLVFVNAVHYIQRFDHAAPIARKRPGTMLRTSVASTLESITDAGYQERLQRHEQFVAEDAKRNEDVRTRIAAGQEVSKFERNMLDRPAPQPPGRFEYVRRYFTDAAWAKVEGDEAAIRSDLLGKLPFMRTHGWYELVVDEELQQFGIANNDIQLLGKAIAAWAAGKDPQLARTLLVRYTNESFATVAEWQQWLTKNRERLFFTEAGGYKWLVNTIGDRAPVGAKSDAALGTIPAKTASAVDAAAPTAVPTAVPTAQNPVAASMQVRALPNGNHVVAIIVEIFPGWHAYDELPDGSPYTAMVPTLTLPKGVAQVGEWRRPIGKAYAADPSLAVFEGQFAFACELSGSLADVRKVTCELGYQVCDADMCQPPTSLHLVVTGGGGKTTFSISR